MIWGFKSPTFVEVLARMFQIFWVCPEWTMTGEENWWSKKRDYMRLCGSGKRCDFLYLRHRSRVDSLKEWSFLESGEHGMGLPKEGDLGHKLASLASVAARLLPAFRWEQWHGREITCGGEFLKTFWLWVLLILPKVQGVSFQEEFGFSFINLIIKRIIIIIWNEISNRLTLLPENCEKSR